MALPTSGRQHELGNTLDEFGSNDQLDLESDDLVEGLTDAELQRLADKVYNLLRYELMIDRERSGRLF